MNKLSFIFTLIIWQLTNAQTIRCSYCKENINNQFVIVNKIKYHKECYKNHIQPKCNICEKNIVGVYNIENGKKYHEQCYDNFLLPKCDICIKPIKKTYIIDKWNNKYHKSHTFKLPNCDSCARIICKNITKGGFKVDSKRSVCNLCKPFLVNKKKLVHNFARQVKSELKEVGFKRLPKNIPIKLVQSRKELKKLSKMKHLNLSGYTKYEYETLNDQIIKKDYKIYILSNLHQTEFKSVLAHEFLHVFLFENDFQLSPEIREGFCNLGSALIYKNDDSKYSILKLEAMNSNPDPVYGLGFKKMSKLLQQNGWDILLRRLAKL